VTAMASDSPSPSPPDGESGVSVAVDGRDEPVVAGSPVVVRRHAGVAALVGAGASAVAIAYLWRASQTMAALDWALCGAMAVVAAVYLATLVDSRTPLLVADDLGVRIRLGDEWRGLPWEAIGQVVVHPRGGPLRDGRLVLAPRSLARALDGVAGKARRHVALNQKLYGAPLAVPIGFTTRVSGDGGVAERVAALALGRADVLELDLRAPEADPAAVSGATGHPAPATGATGRPRLLGEVATIVSRIAKGRDRDVDAHPDTNPEPEPAGTGPAGTGPAGTRPTETRPAGPEPRRTPPAAPALLRETRPALRTETILPTAGAAVLLSSAGHDEPRRSLPEGRELRRPGSVDLVVEPVVLDERVRPISTLGDPVEPLVIDDFAVEPAYDPVIGPELAAARTRLGISVDDLAERTRIRPHVIESIEVDDFAPCGGDFYVRGHLRTLARILGKDAGPLLEVFEERYASAPINARKVFEAELATGMTGSMRSTVGGPRWGLLVGVVLSLVLVWGVVRLFSTAPVEMVEVPAPALNGSALNGSALNGSAGSGGQMPLTPAAPGARGGRDASPTNPARRPVNVLLSASQSDARVVVRDGSGSVVFEGELVLGERRTLRVSPPVRVRASDGGAVEVRMANRDLGLLGTAGEPARRTFTRAALRGDASP
jgi:hypothetical protein